MNLSYKVVAFYTLDTPYEVEVQKLKDSLNKYNIPHYIKGYKDRGQWIKNCAIKPEFILHCLQNLDTPILYVDADAVFDREPENIFTNDFYYYRFRGSEALSGTLYLTKKCIPFIETWVELQKEHQLVFDQEVMSVALNRHPELNCSALPERYIKIFDLMSGVKNSIVTHYQASRRYRKNKVKEIIMDSSFKLPQKVRVLEDGTFYLVRRDRVIEEYMDKHCKRWGKERRWYPNIDTSNMKVFENMYKGKTAAIIGKGPSLDLLNQVDVDGPVIALNEAIHTVEKLGLSNDLMVVQQDSHLKDTCVPSKESTKMFVSHISRNSGMDFSNRLIYRPIDFGLSDASLSAQIALALCKIFGVKDVKMYCFDACVNGATDYADVIGYSPKRNGDPKRFLKHKKIIDGSSRGLKLEWIIPQKTSSSDDKPQP